MAVLGAFDLILYVLLVIAGILALLLPFFILRIRREAIDSSASLRRIEDLLRARIPEAANTGGAPRPDQADTAALVDRLTAGGCTVTQPAPGQWKVATLSGTRWFYSIGELVAFADQFRSEAKKT